MSDEDRELEWAIEASRASFQQEWMFQPQMRGTGQWYGDAGQSSSGTKYLRNSDIKMDNKYSVLVPYGDDEDDLLSNSDSEGIQIKDNEEGNSMGHKSNGVRGSQETQAGFYGNNE
uniref:Uncharacterized protein n=1 Tax=Arundo donax TaxID=35708 RepID=A0A0A9BST7_ARUDO